MGIKKSNKLRQDRLRALGREVCSPLIFEPTPVTGPNLSATLSFSTGEGRESLVLKLRLFKLSEVWGPSAWRMIIETANVRHPFDVPGSKRYFGREIMNPALLPAVDDIKDILLVTAAQKLHGTALHFALSGSDRSAERDSAVRNNMDGFEYWATFNQRPPNQGFKKASYAAMANFYNTMIQTFQDHAPALQEKIAQHASLQPPLRPTTEDRMIFDAKIYDAWLGALGGRPEQLRNGTGLNNLVV